ncbi:hypothetical protein M378DRAFT_14545 [Amanita muscaria Koide BX008]|uniref:Uncharacterized protein n=1 Tax=Amanita muscaria (strain Koide BX008) TaxID=946122 RepID=A0A0C2WEG7_AMAMK|nr:hypothetical protein M378DRAFT_14545 [Amanita muscaria Koide BX008]
MAKQSPPTPVVQTKPEEGSSGGESDVQEGRKKKRKRKKNTDITDPFIDNFELAIDERTWFAQTTQQGFCVLTKSLCSKTKTQAKKPASTVPMSTTNSTATTSTANTTTNAPPHSSKSKQEHAGSRDYPTLVGDESTAMDDGSGGGANTSSLKSDEDGEEVGQKRKGYITVVDHSGKRKVLTPVALENSFPVEMQVEIEALKEAIAKGRCDDCRVETTENWAQKGKFPLKLIERTVFQDYVKYLVDKQEVLLKELTELAKAGFTKAEEEWEKSVQAVFTATLSFGYYITLFKCNLVAQQTLIASALLQSSCWRR